MKAKTYEEALASLISAFKEASTLGTCNTAVIEDIVDWVTRRDSDASQKFGDDVRRGVGGYQALKNRLGHDQNALDLVTRCEAETRTSLANRGFPGLSGEKAK